jgi:mono/diheme cytochrome c family protein
MTVRVRTLMALGVLLWMCSSVAAEDETMRAATAEYRGRVVPLLQKYCHSCHGAEKQKANLNLAAVTQAVQVANDRDRWEVVRDYLQSGEMPPEGAEPRPSDDERKSMIAWVESTLSKADCNLKNPGRVTLRRLNRAEYNNVVRDLLAVDFKPADDFPADDVGYGFDNNGDVLSLDPLLLEKYLRAAEEITRRSIDTAGPAVVPSKVFRGDQLNQFGGDGHDQGRSLSSNGELATDYEFPGDGRYTIGARIIGEQAGPEPVRAAIKVDGRTIREIRIEEHKKGRRFEAVVELPKGKHRVAVAFLNDFYDKDGPDPEHRDRNLILNEVRIVGPGDPIGTIELDEVGDEVGGSAHPRGRNVPASPGLTLRYDFPGEGEFRIRIKAFAQQAGPDPARLALKLNDELVEVYEVEGTEELPGEYEARIFVGKGSRKLQIDFLNDYYQPDHPDEKLRGDRNLIVEKITVAGPLKGYYERVPAGHRLVFFEHALSRDYAEVTRKVLHKFANRAYRRPATEAEVNRLCQLAELVRKDGGNYEESIQIAIQAVLCSPSFLYRPEFGAPGTSAGSAGVQPLSDFELASRLSFFLWSSMPDQELFRAAWDGKLRDPKVLEAQTRRMLKDPRSAALIDGFVTQWLQISKLKDVTPDPKTFPRFNQKLRQAMATETRLFARSIIEEDRSILELIDADYTFVNERLARLYEIGGVEGDEFRRVSLKPENHRGGLLTQASVLTVTSNPTRTSPVKRGKWILEQILGTPPPPPPPDVPALIEDKGQLTGSLRERLQEHRANPGCASCHDRMDPLGFGFENFDGIGVYRTKDGARDIDASGVLPSGESFQGAGDLKALLRAKSTEFARCLTEKLMTYGLGRGLEYYDRCAVDQIVSDLPKDGFKFGSLVVDIVQSEPFRTRKTEEGE